MIFKGDRLLPKSRVNSVDRMMMDSTVIDYSFVTGEADPITKKIW
jgi:hypothetical protein